MRRTNLVLDEQVLKEVTRVLGAKTYSAAVNTTLAEVVRLKKMQTLPAFFGERNLGGRPAGYAGRQAASHIARVPN